MNEHQIPGLPLQIFLDASPVTASPVQVVGFSHQRMLEKSLSRIFPFLSGMYKLYLLRVITGLAKEKKKKNLKMQAKQLLRKQH